MRALQDTTGMSQPQQAKFWLDRLAYRAHRGPGVDTWSSARDRVAKELDIPRATAERIWSRYRDMKDVSGVALMKLMLAYERMCAASEAKTMAMLDEHSRLGGLNAAIESALGAGQGMDHAEH